MGGGPLGGRASDGRGAGACAIGGGGPLAGGGMCMPSSIHCEGGRGGRGAQDMGWRTAGRAVPQRKGSVDAPPPVCDIPSGCCFFTGPWTVTRSSLRILRRVAAFCRPLLPGLLLVLFPRSRNPVVGVPGLCSMWQDVPFARQQRPVVDILGVVLVVAGVV